MKETVQGAFALFIVTVGAEFGKEGIMCVGLDKGKIHADFFSKTSCDGPASVGEDERMPRQHVPLRNYRQGKLIVALRHLIPTHFQSFGAS